MHPRKKSSSCDITHVLKRLSLGGACISEEEAFTNDACPFFSELLAGHQALHLI